MEVSNKTLSILLVLAIIISLGGTIVSLNRLANLRQNTVIGFATSSGLGNVTLDITDVTSITLPIANISFGSGYANGSGFCVLSTTNASNHTYYNCSGFYNETIPSPIKIENNGNKNVTVDFNLSTNATNLFGCGVAPSCDFTNVSFAFNITCAEANCCSSLNSSCAYCPDRFIHPTANPPFTRLCGLGQGANPQYSGLSYEDSRDTLDLDVMVNFTQIINNSGTMVMNITFLATGP